MKIPFKVVSYIDPGRIYMPKSVDMYSANDYFLEPLYSNISKNGIITPLVIRTDKNGKKELVCGKRRLVCARLLRIKRVPCITINCTDLQAALIRLGNRLHSVPDDYFEIADGISDLLTGHGLSPNQISEGLGLPISEVKENMKLLDFPYELRQKALENLSKSQVIMLTMLPSSQIADAIEEIVQKGLNDTQTKEYVNALFSPQKKEPVRKAAIGDIRFFSNSIEKNLCTLSNAGYETDFSITDEDRYIDYKIRIKKKADMLDLASAKIC